MRRAGPEGPRLAVWAYLRRGMLTNLMNPKALLFSSVLPPQFVRPDEAPAALQMLVLGVVCLTHDLWPDRPGPDAVDKVPSRRAAGIVLAVGGLLVALAGKLAMAKALA